MNIISIRHLHLLVWLTLCAGLAAGAGGGTGEAARSERRLVISRQETPGGGSSLRGSYLTTRVSRAFTQTSSYDRPKREESSEGEDEENDKPPDDRKSTIISKLRKNETTVDLSKNTVPVARYPASTESPPAGVLKEKLQPSLSTGFKKSLYIEKFRRNGTRTRPVDLTTLLAFNALTPTPQGGEKKEAGDEASKDGGVTLRPRPIRYPSTTQVAESMPPTAWALAGLRGRTPTTKVRPFVSWSTRLNKPTTQPSPVTEITEPATGAAETTMISDMGDITGEGGDFTATSLPENSSNTSSSTTSSTTTSTSTTTTTTAATTTTNNNDTSPVVIISQNSDSPDDISLYKPEENTISVPPLSSLKNSTSGKLINKKDIVDTAQFAQNREEDMSQEMGHESRLRTDSISSGAKNTPDSHSSLVPMTDRSYSVPSASESGMLLSSAFSSPSISSTESIDIVKNQTLNEKTVLNNTDVEQNDTVSSTEMIEETNVSATVVPDEPQEMREMTESQLQTDITETSSSKNSANITTPESDPSINVINEKKNDEGVSTSTVISAVNSTVTMHVTPVLTTPGNNITNFVDEEGKQEFDKKLPLNVETTTTSKPITQVPNEEISSHKSNKTVINQTINDIKPSNDINLIPIVDTSTTVVPTSSRSNDIRPESGNSSEVKTTQKLEIHEIPETTQSNYIQVHEVVKHKNESESTEVTEAPLTTTPPITTMRTTMSTSVPPYYNSTTQATVIPMVPSESSTLSNDTVTATPTTVTTQPPITTTPTPTSTIVPPLIDVSTTASPMANNTVRSNDITGQEDIKDTSVPIPEQNMTQFQYESPNTPKNDTTPLIIQEPEIDEGEGQFNHTDFDKPFPDHNGDDINEDILPEIPSSGNTTVLEDKNVTRDNNIPVETPSSTTTSAPTTTTTTTSTTPSSTTPNIDDIMATQIDEDQPNISEEDTVYDTGVVMTMYIRLIFDASYAELCREKDQLRDSIVRIFKKYAERPIEKRQVQLVNIGGRDCLETVRAEERPAYVNIFLTDQEGQYDKALNDHFLSLARHNHLDFNYPVTHVEKVIGQHELSLDTNNEIGGTMIAAIVISSIAAVCLFALIILLVIMRKRQSGFNYGQRCTPVSLDDYSLDNISVYNSVRRKAMRASKRSYGNPAFDDPEVVTNPVNFAGLATMAGSKAKTDEEFASLPQVVVKPDELPPGAESKNRYANVIPLPETRVQLQGQGLDQFINANYVKGVKGVDKSYIACQGPMQNTIEDFWRMVWDEQTRLIIMLTPLVENGQEKCADYLPPSEVLDCHRVFGDLQITLKKREAREKYVISSLQLKNLETNLWREVTHMWYSGWPATGVPSETSSITAFLIEARSYSKNAPVVVHCSPGTGRTGTVIAIDIAIRDFEAGRSVDIPKTVVQVRRGRAGAVQTKDQYHFIYKVLHFYATKLTGGGLDSI